MRGVVQRVSRAAVSVDGTEVGSIGPGLVLLIGVAASDDGRDVDALVDKVVGLRIFRDDTGAMNLSVLDVGGSVLVVSQFTLIADVRKGRRPSFIAAADPEVAKPLVDAARERFASHGIDVATGMFGATMQVDLVNDGPVTIVLDVEGGSVR